MSPKSASQTQKELIDYKFNEVFKRLDRIEDKMDGFTFAKQTDLDEFKKDVQENYVKKESLRWLQYVVGGIATGVGVALVIAVFKAIGANL